MTDEMSPGQGSTIFAPQDEVSANRFHVRMMFTTGMGVCADGYSLSSIAIVLPLVLATFGLKSLTGLQSSFLTGSSLAGMAVGALVFGALGLHGRKRYYGVDVTIMALAALAQAFVPSLAWLVVVRVIFGIGAGADYVLSPTIMGEHANRQSRGKMMILGFGVSWMVGAAASGLIALGCLGLGFSDGSTWRIVLAAGALPALAVIWLRRRLPETARFLARVEGDGEATETVLREVNADAAVQADLAGKRLIDRHHLGFYFRRNARAIVVSCLLWFLFDTIGYSSALYGPTLIAKGLGMSPEDFTLLGIAVFSIPALVLAAWLSDRWGRRPMTVRWSLISAVALVIFGLYRGYAVVMVPAIGFVLYGLFGITNAVASAVPTNGMNGVELVPTKVRSLVQGMTVASGRIGATLTAFVFPALFATFGESVAIYVLAGVTVVAALVALLIPEAAGRTLEQASDEELDRSLVQQA